ncbi:MAG: hypothetical protein JWM03_1044 [Rhodocyclales bacterium]|nr:hypothetical protein [Rhodocyclales bacterium]MDB5888172.1 hypothetical protein [Rhodocyclales bacterium]
MRSLRKFFTEVLRKRPMLAFVLMGLSFVLFGLTSLNLIYLFKANINLFLDYGWMVVRDGALRQLFELLAYGYLSLVFYVVFKCCEHQLVHYFTHPEERE